MWEVGQRDGVLWKRVVQNVYERMLCCHRRNGSVVEDGLKSEVSRSYVSLSNESVLGFLPFQASRAKSVQYATVSRSNNTKSQRTEFHDSSVLRVLTPESEVLILRQQAQLGQGCVSYKIDPRSWLSLS